METTRSSTRRTTRTLITAIAFIVFITLFAMAAWKTLGIKPQAVPVAATTKVAVIEITDDGFIPAELKVNSGTTVRWINKTAEPHQVASNPYPEHTDLSGLYAPSAISPGAVYEYTFTKSGSWGYHDQIKPTTGGVVTVETAVKN